jgi:N-methylhydantoinase A/oxoprolinase/acetone carboxylase beta subunit
MSPDAASSPPNAASPNYWLGFDTGGTFTDAAILDGERRVVATAKALTTHWDLSVGIAGAIRAVLAKMPAQGTREAVSLVSVSTTLATNSVVENRHSPVCSVLVGFDDAMVERSGLLTDGMGTVIRVRGGHDATGEMLEPLDEAGAIAAISACMDRVDAFAVSARFSVRNPSHERRLKDLIRDLTGKSVTCAHELSSRLDAPRRALTAALNARLTPQIRQLIEALSKVMAEERIHAPLMIVKGDGSLMRADIALEYPVETVLSGPAASVVGAGFLTGLNHFAVSDMGGTTTDVAIVEHGRPRVSADGALIGGWRTMVEAVDVRTMGLGGDSEVDFDRDLKLRVGPRKVTSLSLLATQFPQILQDLRALSVQDRLPEYPTLYAYRNPGSQLPSHADGLERRTWDALTEEPKRISNFCRNQTSLAALRRLADSRLATIAGFTPSDAMHVLGVQSSWSREAAELAAKILAIVERNGRALDRTPTETEIAQRTHEYVVRESGRIVLNTALAHDPGIDSKAGRWGILGDRLMEDTLSGREFSTLVQANLALGIPLVAIGAPVAAYYSDIASRLGCELHVPAHAGVCNAVGAVAGVVSETIEILVNQPSFKVFRVHDPARSVDYSDLEEAVSHAERVATELALNAAVRAGASNPAVQLARREQRAHMGTGGDYVAELTVRATATGRPLAGSQS